MSDDDRTLYYITKNYEMGTFKITLSFQMTANPVLIYNQLC